jgi:MerR family transcriptional regulator, redox-sensitive transcriptional activator SoxR
MRYMPQLTVSEVARQLGLRPSAIRYYERIGVLLPAQRISGQRRYDTTVLHRLAVIQRARQTGFTLDEIRQLFFGFRSGTPASKRWRQLSRRKLTELKSQLERIRTMQHLLRRMTQCCRCDTLDECGKGIFRKAFSNVAVKPRTKVPRCLLAPAAYLRGHTSPSSQSGAAHRAVCGATPVPESGTPAMRLPRGRPPRVPQPQ